MSLLDTDERKPSSSKKLRNIFVTITFFIVLALFIKIIPNVFTMGKYQKESQVMGNMHSILLAVEDYANENKSKLYPIDTFIRTRDIDPQLKTNNTMMIFLEQYLTDHQLRFVNPYDSTIPPLEIIADSIGSQVKLLSGQVAYCPLHRIGKGAKDYRIFGMGKNKLLKLVLTNDTSLVQHNH
jgi:hypothetical protein